MVILYILRFEARHADITDDKDNGQAMEGRRPRSEVVINA